MSSGKALIKHAMSKEQLYSHRSTEECLPVWFLFLSACPVLTQCLQSHAASLPSACTSCFWLSKGPLIFHLFCFQVRSRQRLIKWLAERDPPPWRTKQACLTPMLWSMKCSAAGILFLLDSLTWRTGTLSCKASLFPRWPWPDKQYSSLCPCRCQAWGGVDPIQPCSVALPAPITVTVEH